MLHPIARRRTRPICARGELRNLRLDHRVEAELREHSGHVARRQAHREARRIAIGAREPPAPALRREAFARALERDEPEAQRIGHDLGVKAPELPRTDREFVGMQLQAGQLARIELAHRRRVARGQVQPAHDGYDLRLARKILGHENRAGDGPAVDLDLPILGAPAHTDLAVAELLPEHREIGDVERGARETSFIAIGRPEERDSASHSSSGNTGRLPSTVTPLAARNSGSMPPKRSAARRNAKRPSAWVARLELHREAPRRAEVTFRVETAVRGEHEIELQIRGLGRRFRKRLWQPQRDAREIRADRDPRGRRLIRAVRRDQQAALPARLSRQEVAQRQIERARHGVDRHFAFEIEARAIPLLLGRRPPWP